MIDIPEERYEEYKRIGDSRDILFEAIRKGTVLPEHGDLIDRNELLKQYGLENATKYGNKDAEQQKHSYSTMMMYEIADMIEDAEAIIPATKESE